MTNLKEETLNMLAICGKTPEDVLWVGGRGEFYITFDEFLQAADFKYDSGYGGAEINQDLVVVGEDWWLERGEYDGSEWWEFKTMPTRPDFHASQSLTLKLQN